MNTPNRLTIIRILIVPFMVATLLWDFPHHYLISGLLFGAASLTDYFDGKIAREHGLVTDFGKFADPLADKILVISVFVCFVSLKLCDPILVILTLFREFAVTSIRLVAASSGRVVAANIWGKVKTVTQIVAIIAVYVFRYFLELCSLSIIPLPTLLFEGFDFWLTIVSEILLWISAVFAVISGIIYIRDNIDCISDK